MILLSLLAAAHIATHITPLSGDLGWDYVTADPSMHRIFVTHGDRVLVIDTTTHKEIGSIPANGAHGVALAKGLNRGFVSNGRGNDVTVFEYDTLKPVAQWKTTGDNPDAILYDPFSKRVFTFNGRGKNSTVFDATTGTVAATIPLGGKPEFSQTDGAGRVYVNIEDTSELAVINPKKAEVVKRWPLTGCEEPTGLAIDIEHDRLISVCGNKTMAITNAGSGKVVTVAIGSGVDGVAYDSKKGLAYSSNGADGTITVVSVSDAKAVATLPTARGARTIAVDEKTHRLYLPTAKFSPPEKEGERPKIVPGTFEVIEVEE
jgi:DNA-binding beta-propeller fold protein YncE